MKFLNFYYSVKNIFPTEKLEVIALNENNEDIFDVEGIELTGKEIIIKLKKYNQKGESYE